MFENPRRGRQARNFTTNAPKILDLKSSSEQIFSRKLPLGAPEQLFTAPATATTKTSAGYDDNPDKLIMQCLIFGVQLIPPVDLP